VAFAAVALKEFFLCLWDRGAAAIALSSAYRAHEEVFAHHAVEILFLNVCVHQIRVQSSELPLFKRETTHTAPFLLWQCVSVVAHPPIPPFSLWDTADGVGGHWRGQWMA
jgi:hypothetical protein